MRLPCSAGPRGAAGFTYLGLLLLVAIIGVAAGATVELGAVAYRREAERELLFVGQQYRNAFRSYAEASAPNTPSKAPTRLEELLQDNRFPFTKRHLRRIYPDPLTGSTDWGLIHGADHTSIIGVYSKAAGTPIKQANFPDDFFHFKGKDSYAKWVFVWGAECDDNGCALDANNNALVNH